MKILLLTLLGIFIPASVIYKVQQQPKVVSIKKLHQKECDKDLHEFCVGEEITILNPLMKPVLVEINCGPEYDKSEVTIPARTRYTIRIELTTADENEAPYCGMSSWKIIE